MPRGLAIVSWCFVGLVMASFALGWMLPTQWEVERTRTMWADPVTVWASVGDLGAWPEFSPWMGEGMTWEVEGDRDRTVVRFDGAGGPGELHVTAYEPRRRLAYAVRYPGSEPMLGEIELVDDDGLTEVTWRDGASLGAYPSARITGPVMRVVVGRQLHTALKRLSSRAEAAEEG